MAEDLEMAQFREIFLSEAKENLQVLNQSLVVLEKNPGDHDKINAIFRVAHTLKGMAATMGFEKITEISHHMEDVLDKIRQGTISVTTQTVDALFDCLDVLSKLVNGVEASGSREVIVLDPLIKRLQSFSMGEENIQTVADSSLKPPIESGKAELPQEAITPVAPSDKEPVPSTDVTELKIPASVAVKQQQKSAAATETIRVNVSHLDILMNLVGEMVINKGRLEEIGERYKIPELDEALSFFDRLGSDLQNAVLKTRMVPVSHIFDRFPRMVRDLARRLNKEVNLEIFGADIEIDRMLLEQVNEPLVHLLRNAIDHGIETKEERIQSRKNSSGRISLTARREQSAVAIEVVDDGKGMSPDKLRDIAVARGILTQEAAGKMSDKETFFLICDPRFSSAKEVTDISGRGVGMDVVKAGIEAVSGVLQIDSTMGKGSTFTLKLPLSLAIIRVLLIRVHRETYAIPLSNIAEIVSIGENEIRRVDHKEVIVLREKVLPLVRLDKILGTVGALKSATHGYVSSVDSGLKVVVVEVADKKVGFVVTDLVGRKEVVVKTLAGICKQAKGFSGATILGDGSVVLILDVGVWIS